MFVYEKNLSKLGQIVETTVENIELLSLQQIEDALVSAKRLSKVLSDAKKVLEKSDEGLDTQPEE